ncbi:MAG: hypothetical protein N2441_04775 [Rhodocyclaceae bacterium]|nr:hypothetical protein [Rhodocyclaceae bacterium]
MVVALKHWLLVIVLWAALDNVAAQLRDPTRPPPAIETATMEEAPREVSLAGLQSIMRPKAGKPKALIDGRWVELGGWVRDARLVRIGSDHVLLRSSLGEEVLRLTPAVEKTMAKPVATKNEERMTGQKPTRPRKIEENTR